MISHTRFRGLTANFGVARWDITPGLEVSSKNWGASERWFAKGVHRPLTGTALAIASEGGPPLVLLSLDLGWWRSRRDAVRFLEAMETGLGLSEANLIVHFTHTHAGPALDSNPPAQSNPEATAAYIPHLLKICLDGARAAIADLQPGSMLFHSGSCDLAANRDFPDPEKPGRFLTGFFPEGPADDTLLVARVLDPSNRTRATLVNYACHPTTLAWENDLLSPDFPGAMREVIESSTQAPCLFLQGASGELGPREQYSGNPALADRHGRVLGHAALSLIESMAEGCASLAYRGVMESGAPLALWSAEASPLSDHVSARAPSLELPLQENLPTAQSIQERLKDLPAGFARERLSRQLRIREAIGEGNTLRETLRVWELGEAFLVAVPFEAYSHLQKDVRAAAKGRPVLVLNTSNAFCGYIPPAPLYQIPEIYTVWQTPYGQGSAEAVSRLACQSLQ